MNKDIYTSFLNNKFKYSDVKFIGEGWNSFAFTCGDYTFRFPKKDINIYTKEKKILDCIKEKISTETPDINIFFDSKISYSKHKTLIGKYWRVSEVDESNEKNRNNFINSTVNFFTELHCINIENLSITNSEYRYTKPNCSFNQINKILQEHFSLQDIKKIYSKYENALSKPVTEFVLTHQDFSGKNSLLDNKQNLVGVFDWGNSCFYEPEFDFHRFFDIKNPNLLKDIVYKYEKVSKKQLDIKRIIEHSLLDTLKSLIWLHSDDFDKNFISDKNKWLMEKLSWQIKTGNS